MAVLTVAAIAAAPVVLGAATATAGAATASGGVAVAATGTATAETFAGAVSIGVSLGPVGWMVLGCSYKAEEDVSKTAGQTYTLDCWKPVLHDQSIEPSNGMLLKDITADSRIKNVTVDNSENSGLPKIILQNIWDEQFRIEYLALQTTHVAHAVRI